jgi:hypothetical protein
MPPRERRRRVVFVAGLDSYTLEQMGHLTTLSVDNFEGIATRPAPAGGRYIYLMSDNNQNPQQRTLLLQFYAPDIAASDGAP